MKKCNRCVYCYCGDMLDISGLNCELNPFIKIINSDKMYCRRYKFSLIKFLFGI